ncbi:sulfatase [Paenibacillus sp. J5C_2022]|uniref:sulfatase n=1 Tax=Paenibacillus sp. J5C2022 TaxID=2977129 RepID=UPI0021D0CAB4|nr:sulfatase [Paenibacillus sp. J5C2022]MCU6707761.1 sulfatase [Paenibacillus sp. J5C2022]
MRAIMIMFDTLTRHFLPPYGGDWVHAPNFARLAERTITFDNSYVGSMPCMPARRELHTGRYNFLHRSWGPLEPFDDSMPELLKKQGIYTHLVTDHHHYWEDGGANYHNRYNTYELIRGQEGDPWKGHVKDPVMKSKVEYKKDVFRQDQVNREYIRRDREEQFPQARTFTKGLEFIRTNVREDSWFLQIETFDPHEPFYAPQNYRDLYPHNFDEKSFDWPAYGVVNETPEEIAHLCFEYAALLSMCDAYLGKVLDLMDEHDMWEDTMLIVNTDHGFLMGERDYWAKNIMPWYNEIAHTPLFIWDPRCGKKAERRDSLVQMIDMAPTLLDFFDLQVPGDMTGRPLRETIDTDKPVREAALFGIHGGHVNCTDGRYVYMRAPVHPDNNPLNEYTLMPSHMKNMFTPAELRNIQLREPFTFTKDCMAMKIPVESPWFNPYQFGTKLFDLKKDPYQQYELQDATIELRFIRILAELMTANDAPCEQFDRLGIPQDGRMDEASLMLQKKLELDNGKVDLLQDKVWTREAQNQWRMLLRMTPESARSQLQKGFERYVTAKDISHISHDIFLNFVEQTFPAEKKRFLSQLMKMAGRVN